MIDVVEGEEAPADGEPAPADGEAPASGVAPTSVGRLTERPGEEKP